MASPRPAPGVWKSIDFNKLHATSRQHMQRCTSQEIESKAAAAQARGTRIASSANKEVRFNALCPIREKLLKRTITT